MAGRVAVRGASCQWLGLGHATDGGVESDQESRGQSVNMEMMDLINI